MSIPNSLTIPYKKETSEKNQVSNQPDSKVQVKRDWLNAFYEPGTVLAQGHKAHEWEGWKLGSGSKSVWLQVLTIAPSCLRENVFLFGLRSKRHGWHRAWCSGNKMPQLQKQRLSWAVLWDAVLLEGISGQASLHIFEGPRHSNIVQVVQNLSFWLRCLSAMKTSLWNSKKCS